MFGRVQCLINLNASQNPNFPSLEHRRTGRGEGRGLRPPRKSGQKDFLDNGGLKSGNSVPTWGGGDYLRSCFPTKVACENLQTFVQKLPRWA